MTYNDIKTEVLVFQNEMESAIMHDTNISKLCVGWRILYSDLRLNPDILFIGINPGSGREGIHLDPLPTLEYIDTTEYEPEKRINDYKLANRTREIFELGSVSQLLHNSVKSNIYYNSTRCEKDIYRITDYLNSIGKSDLRRIYFENSRKWTKALVELIKPKLVICEGKEAYKVFTDLYIGATNFNGFLDSIFIDDIQAHVIGYSRGWANINKSENKYELGMLINKLSN